MRYDNISHNDKATDGNEMEYEILARTLLMQQRSRYPKGEVNDCIKALYQAAFGCGHFVESEERACEGLHAEM